MITWIVAKTGLSALAVKLILLLVASGGIFYALRLYSNRVYSEGFKEGKTAGAIEMEKAKQAEWAAKEKAIAESAAGLDIEKRSVEADKARLSQDRANLSRSLKDGLASLAAQTAARRERDYETTAAIPGDKLDDAIRQRANELGPAR